ncbi:hypothetical protein D3C84_506100 [compost metagenome]
MRLAGLDLLSGLEKPVADQIGATGHAAFVELAQAFGVGSAEFAAHLLVTEKRRITNNHLRRRPLRFAAVFGNQCIAVFNAVERTQDRVLRNRPAVALAPLQVTDPYGNAGQFGGVFVDLQAEHVGRAGFDVHLPAEAEQFQVNLCGMLQVFQGMQGEVEEVARAARRVEHAKAAQAFEITLIGGHGGLVWSAFHTFALSFFQGGLDGRPFCRQRLGDQRVDQFGDGAGVGVVRAKWGAGVWVQAALKQGAEDGRVDGAPVEVLCGVAEHSQVVAGQGWNVDGLEQAAVEPG